MKTVSLVLLLTLVTASTNVRALSLCSVESLERAYKTSTAIVAATAESVHPELEKDQRNILRVMWQVNESWKGPYKHGDRFVTTSSAGRPIKNGEPMLLYLKGSDPYDIDLQPKCSRSGALQNKLLDVRDLYGIKRKNKDGT